MKWEIDPSTCELVISSEEGDVDLIQELQLMSELMAISQICEEFEGELDLVNPEEIGALTEAPIFIDLTTGAHPRDGGTHGFGDIYWFPNYQVEGMIDTLAEKGEVRLERAITYHDK